MKTIIININLGCYQNEFILIRDGSHSYHNLIPDNPIVPFTTYLSEEEHEFELYYPKVTPKQIKEAIQKGFDIIDVTDPNDNTDFYAYGDLIKQILAFIGLAHYFKIINDQETQIYLDKLKQIEHNWFLLEPEENDIDLEIAIDTLEILKLYSPKRDDIYYITFNYKTN